MTKLVGNVVIVLAGAIMLVGAAIGLGIILLYAAAVVLVRRLKPLRRPALTAGS